MISLLEYTYLGLENKLNRPYLFLSGEFRQTMGVVFERDHWSHTMSPSKLIIDNGILRRNHIYTENLKGVIFYADMDNKELEVQNLQLIINNNIPCWPNPNALLNMMDRHNVLQKCIEAGFAGNNKRLFVKDGENIDFNYPFVLKTGNEHRGQGKFLINKKEDLPNWDGIATAEPYFEGRSCRLLVVGNDVFGIYFDNENSWIKNSCGAEASRISDADIPKIMIDHAKNITAYWDLDCAGVDYVIDKGGVWNFLEINKFAGLDVEGIELYIKEFLRLKMDQVENG